MRVEDGEKKQRAELRFDGIAGCLRTPGGGSSKQVVVVINQGKTSARDLTGAEAAKLMGLPDGYKLPTLRNAALKICGDGVVVPVVEWLRRELLDSLAEAAVQEVDGQEDGNRARA